MNAGKLRKYIPDCTEDEIAAVLSDRTLMRCARVACAVAGQGQIPALVSAGRYEKDLARLACQIVFAEDEYERAREVAHYCSSSIDVNMFGISRKHIPPAMVFRRLDGRPGWIPLAAYCSHIDEDGHGMGAVCQVLDGKGEKMLLDSCEKQSGGLVYDRRAEGMVSAARGQYRWIVKDGTGKKFVLLDPDHFCVEAECS
jgi:hypothetical protein